MQRTPAASYRVAGRQGAPDIRHALCQVNTVYVCVCVCVCERERVSEIIAMNTNYTD